ncbi:MAG: GNAT family N-acetyltransferase [Acholeplasmataceae bacterium]|nr:GNAT family N-acetyltransferase [Acholeplasmataceae bacterium]
MSYQFVDCKTSKEMNDVKLLLKHESLRYEDKITSTIGFYDEHKLIATGSIYENTIKMIAVDKDYRHDNLTGQILIKLIEQLQEKGISKYFIYTTPQNKKYFQDFSFSLVAETPDIVLLENNVMTINDTLLKIKMSLPKMTGTISAIVMNCNPVTFGHLYLIESCAKENDHVIIFLVEENKSVFSFDVRLKLLKASTNHIKNVHIIPSTSYIISSATFPTYFLKELSEASQIYMNLDITIFKNYFMPIFNIAKRYVGDEPFDMTTNAYNQTMENILKSKVKIIHRIEANQAPISASIVRKLAKERHFDQLKFLVPKPTYLYLTSEEGQALFND